MTVVVSKLTIYRAGISRNEPGIRFVPWIDCDTEDGHLVRINFPRLGQPLEPNVTMPLFPDNPEYEGILFGGISAPADQFTWYLDLLRNEAHCWVLLDTEDPSRNRLGTSWVSVGWGHLE